MLYVPHKGITRTQTNMSSVGTSSFGTGVASNAAADTKGSNVELIASTNFDAWIVELIVASVSASGTARRGSLDILIGAATEDILIADLLVGQAPTASASLGYRSYLFPLYIPSGSRISAAFACSTGSITPRVGIALHGGNGSPPFKVAGKVDTYGATAAGGTAITPGSTGVEGSWTQIAASSNRDHFAFLATVQCNDATMAVSALSVDVGIGSATEEQIGAPQNYGMDTTERMWTSGPDLIFHDVPASTRLVMRASSSTTPETTQAAMYGLS